METKVLETALLEWPAWRQSVRRARRSLGYDPRWDGADRERWWQQHGSAEVLSVCRSALRSLDLPLTFGRYWAACVFSDYERNGHPGPDRIRLPLDWVEHLRVADAAPPGAWRIGATFFTYHRGDEVTLDPAVADTVRVYPPQLTTVTVPRVLPEGSEDLQVALLPRREWRRHWRNRAALPLLMDAPEGAVAHLELTYSSVADKRPIEEWTRTATLEAPPWAWSEETVRWGREQLAAIRAWYEEQNLAGLSRQVRQVTARHNARRRGLEPKDWSGWLGDYRGDRLTYRELVDRVYADRTGGRPARESPSQPPKAKLAADWVRLRFLRAGIAPGHLQRRWWQ